MTRSVKEWVALNDDQAIPARVKVRIFDKCGRKCVVCTLPIVGKLRPAFDHIIALVNGGKHRESNLQLLCVPCHAVKTQADVAEKSAVYRKRAKFLGVAPKGKQIRSQGFGKSAPQRSASRPIKRGGETQEPEPVREALTEHPVEMRGVA